VLERGLQRDANFEKTWPDILGDLGEAGKGARRDDKQDRDWATP
jgi:hypothetical protein